jgi:predicted TIM-barrel fold metal-dependent hydrolase
MLARHLVLVLLGAFIIYAPIARANELPIIDAHSQVGHDIELDEILELMDEARVSRTILSFFGKRRPIDLVSFASRHPDRITAAIKTKGGVFMSNRLGRYQQFLKKQARLPQFGAMGEVIMWHAEKTEVAVASGHGKTITPPQQVVPPDDPRVKAALDLAVERKWPFVLHIEFAAAGADRDTFMDKMENLLTAHTYHPFALIHMGQLEAKEVKRLIDGHPNIYFITSHANPIFSQSIQPWINVFAGKSLAPQWKDLMIRHPDRFVLGFDNVMAQNWRKHYVKQVALWRRALSELPADVTHAVAHGNAERLWNLPPAR